MEIRVNLGCGQTPTKGWRNFDNSLSLRLAKYRFATKVLGRLRFLNDAQLQFIEYARDNEIEYGDVTKRLPLSDNSVDVLYTSHMLEHLDRREAEQFCVESFRVLRPGGIIRIAVPDIKRLAAEYLETGDADAFVGRTLLSVPRASKISEKVRLVMIGNRHHQWMYDGVSLSALLRTHGFEGAFIVPAGSTNIANHHPLDLHERADESVYVEAARPVTS